ncbi:hypothetical protein GCM10007079_30990 [Nocardiopsis terrae]|nr:hypothetical protein GCM10007079_30990 [Nocardiopsis terrae]
MLLGQVEAADGVPQRLRDRGGGRGRVGHGTRLGRFRQLPPLVAEADAPVGQGSQRPGAEGTAPPAAPGRERGRGGGAAALTRKR